MPRYLRPRKTYLFLTASRYCHPHPAYLTSPAPLQSVNVELKGEVLSLANPPSGCYFHPRCAYAVDLCRTQPPDFREINPGHFVACHCAKEIELPGISLK